jgi:hypothetical protein
MGPSARQRATNGHGLQSEDHDEIEASILPRIEMELEVDG